MTESFKCPSCSAPLEFEGKPLQKCRFCGSNVIVPASVIQGARAFGGIGNIDFGDLSALTGKAQKIAEIQRFLQGGNKIQAIKIFRETFGTGLREAKDAVEAMERGESVDISGMQIQTATARVDLRSNPQNIEAAKKVGYAVGGSILGSVVITMILIVGAILGIFYLVSRSVDKAIDKTSPVPSQTPATPEPMKKPATQASIAQELLKFGGEGLGAGKFKDNRTIAVDADGKIFSADYSAGRIQVFDAGGNFQTQILSDTTRTVDALGLDRKGNLFVLQGYDVFRLNKETGEKLGKYRVDYATDLAIGLDGKLYVSTLRGELAVLSADGAKLKNIQIGKDLNLESIEQLAVDGAGNFFLLDARTRAVFKLSPDGKLLTRFGGSTAESGDKAPKAQFSGSVEDLAVDSQGRLYVSQVSRIGIFDANGNFVNDFKTTQAFGMAFNDKDELFVAERPFVVKYKVSL
jgi:sugar lactone lactonase YvrE